MYGCDFSVFVLFGNCRNDCVLEVCKGSLAVVTDNDKLVLENIEIRDNKLYARPNGYDFHAFIYCNSKDTDDEINEMDGVIVENNTFEKI